MNFYSRLSTQYHHAGRLYAELRLLLPGGTLCLEEDRTTIHPHFVYRWTTRRPGNLTPGAAVAVPYRVPFTMLAGSPKVASMAQYMAQQLIDRVNDDVAKP